jgi:carbon monoxide dehydrogenase subunit G
MMLTERYEIPAPLASVAPLFQDVLLLVPHVPGAQVHAGTGEGPFEGTLSVAFGPRVIKLGGSFTYRYDPETRTGRLDGSGSDARGNSRATGHATFSISPAPDGAAPESAAPEGAAASAVTQVDVDVDFTLTGPLAMVAETGAPHVARSIFADFSQSLTAQLAATPAEAPPRPADTAAPAPVNGLRLIWSALPQVLASLAARVLRRRRGSGRHAEEPTGRVPPG